MRNEDARNHDENGGEDVDVGDHLVPLAHQKKTTLPLKVAPEARLFKNNSLGFKWFWMLEQVGLTKQ